MSSADDAALAQLAWDDDELRELPAVLASTVTTRRVRWAWKGRIPFGKLSSVEGDPGDGKSLMTIDLAARWSAGKPMPDGTESGGPFHVILVSAEDDEEDTITPRLTVAGARLDNVSLVTSGATPDTPFMLDAIDLAMLERLIVATGARVVVLDPLTAFLPSGVDSHNDPSVRRALWPLKSLARRTGCAIIVVRHLNKGGAGVKAIYRGNGSIAFIGAFRCGFAVARDPDDEPDGRLLAAVKSNISRLAPTLCWRVESTPDGEIPYIAWGGVSTVSAQQALDGPRRSYGDDRAEQEDAVRKYERDFLLGVLADGPLSWKDIVERGRADGFTEMSLRRARADTGLVKLIGVDGNASVRWARPSTSDASDTRDSAPSDHLLSDEHAKAGLLKSRASEQVANEPLSDMDRQRAIDSADELCYACDSRDVTRFYAPWWTIACRAHRPSLNGGEP